MISIKQECYNDLIAYVRKMAYRPDGPYKRDDLEFRTSVLENMMDEALTLLKKWGLNEDV